MANEPVVTIVGNVAGEPELKFLGSGAAVCNFSVAATPRVKHGDEWADGETMWVRCAAWRQLAENVSESIVKGTRVIVSGRLKVRSFDQDGQKRTSIEMDVDAIGPELSFATASVNKVSRGGSARPSSGSTSRSDDPWSSSGDDTGAPF